MIFFQINKREQCDAKQVVGSLKYIENFSNPYVKIILVCKICNKEQSLRFSNNWRQHYLTHAAHNEKPHKCQHCNKSFIRADRLRQHVNKYHSLVDSDQLIKQEEYLPIFSTSRGELTASDSGIMYIK